MISLFLLTIIGLLKTSVAQDEPVTCLVNGYDSRMVVPKVGYVLGTMQVLPDDTQGFLQSRASLSTNVLQAEIIAIVFLVPVDQVPRKADGQVDLEHETGLKVNVHSGSHFETHGARTVTIAFFSQCPDGFSGVACDFGSSFTVDISCSMKRNDHFDIEWIWNRRSTALNVKEGNFVFFRGAGTDRTQKMFFDVKQSLVSQVNPVVLEMTEIVPHFSNTADLPSTSSAILGESFDLMAEAPIIVGFFLKSLSAASGLLGMEGLDLQVNFGIGAEPLEADAPFRQGECPPESKRELRGDERFTQTEGGSPIDDSASSGDSSKSEIDVDSSSSSGSDSSTHRSTVATGTVAALLASAIIL